jgi:hypothetical protein
VRGVTISGADRADRPLCTRRSKAFLDGHVSAFAFFGGVPVSILYDNLKIAVARILGDGKRQRTHAFYIPVVE